MFRITASFNVKYVSFCFVLELVISTHIVQGCFAGHDDVITWKQFSALLAFCLGNPWVTDEFSSQRASNADFYVSLM